jgi:multicomponent Na+:H+ antiporter subunit G
VRVLGEVLLLAGALLTLLAAIGVVRFDDVFVRMHALGKATTAGLVLALLGGAVALDHPNDVTSLLLAAFLHVATSPIGNVLVARATYLAEGIAHGIDTRDELAEADAAAGVDRATR